MIAMDLMHIADLGISQALVGNVMYEWFSLLGGGQTRARSTLGEMMTMIAIASKHLGFDKPINDLTFTMFKQEGKTPRMRTKAAETRIWLPYSICFFRASIIPTQITSDADIDASSAWPRCTKSLTNGTPTVHSA